MSGNSIGSYFGALGEISAKIEVSKENGALIEINDAADWIIAAARKAHEDGRRLLFIGNGGSATIASHMAVDFSKNGKLRAQAFNDSAFLTCLGNDLGYEEVFKAQIEMHGVAGDLLVAISSSGRSPNILKAVAAAKSLGCPVVTLSGFSADNPLRSAGDVNFYVPSDKYGYVELLHSVLLHAVLDISMYGQAPAVFGSNS